MIARRGFTAVCLSLPLMALSSLAHADTISLRMGSGHPIGLLAYTETAHKWFAPELKKRIEERTEHKVKIQELHAGQVAKVTEVLEATRDGLLDIGFISLIFEPSNGFLQTFSLFLPFGSPDAEVVTKAAQATFAEFPEMKDVFEKQHNQVYLGGSCLANYGLGTNFAWEKFADLEGHKIAGAGTNLDWIVKATPVASNLNEAYQSIQSGVYEGYVSASTWWKAFKLNEVAPYFTKADFGAQYVNAVTINKQKWDRLPKEVQDILKEMGEEWAGVTAEVCKRNDASGLEQLKALKVDVREISDEARKEWATALKDFPQRMATDAASRGLSGAKVMNFYMTKLEELGHKWPYRYEVK
ncbi:TRAP dicarboxylate transporter, DctP subunit [Candidatus Filomicrobium marinum]|uniref:TRAP dicarboxylate transporter, DctP subunit n=3 Tax=Filomicrobium TaxID=119044 RepID=A0A0D6JEL7_9HYPH|nr:MULTISPECIES: C4-dicarboxylate TRAP transporter substrate-binding protein [Filomicrobium]MCV0370375.1 C4-dicarboxylate TRAP transporter substrate-binding protein [Filomicrobium sp.]CFX21084.1 TRAP dicarboxylate transporter, DctP subunit [Candidatus Filomicrobium marinum]CPR18731.1 TRAP dicarboxylate transporter, DctP subunit [Candidatus Filomicrobium marinum]SDO15040.1 TRAP-type C4-dicarboxylate transport system, substrate-binding protein [Filomicrobium insigne]